MKNQKNNTPKESTDWNDFWKNLKERSNGKIQKPDSIIGSNQNLPGLVASDSNVKEIAYLALQNF